MCNVTFLNAHNTNGHCYVTDSLYLWMHIISGVGVILCLWSLQKSNSYCSINIAIVLDGYLTNLWTCSILGLLLITLHPLSYNIKECITVPCTWTIISLPLYLRSFPKVSKFITFICCHSLLSVVHVVCRCLAMLLFLILAVLQANISMLLIC